MDCDNCGKAGTSWCDECNEFFCLECGTDHPHPLQDMCDGEIGEDEIVDIEETEALHQLAIEEDPHITCTRLFYSLLDESILEKNEYISGRVTRELKAVGYSVIDNFVPSALASELACEAARLRANGILRPSALSSAGDALRDSSARSDLHVFLHPNQPPCDSPDSPIRAVIGRFVTLYSELATVLRLRAAAHEEEYQLAMYPGGGSGYARHRDAFPDDGIADNVAQRRVTAILYTSGAEWTPTIGGQLRLWLTPAQRSAAGLYQKGTERANEVLVDPKGGRLLIFLSGCIDHEVLACSFERVALTAWLH